LDQTFRAIIEVVNRASAPIHKINADIYSMIAPITAVGAAVAAVAEETGIVALGEQATVAVEKVGALGRELGALLGPLALIGGIASAEGLLEINKKAAEFGEALVHSSEKTGVDIPVLARLHYAAKLEDVDPAVFDKGIERLNANLFKAMRGKNKDMDAMLTKFEGAGWRKHIHNVEDALGAVADAYQKAQSPFMKAGVVATAFGQRMGAGMIPVLLKTKTELRELGDEFERFYGKWTPERAKEAQETADNWKRLSGAGEGLALTIGSAITPAMMDMLVPLREWIVQNREMIGQKANAYVKQVGDGLKAVDWKGIGEVIRFVWSGFKGLADIIGAKGLLIAGAALIFGPIVKSAIEAAVALGRLAFQFGVAAVRMGILAATGVAGFFADLVTGIRLAIPAMAALDLAMDANPIGVVILAVGALAAVVYEIYEHWAPIARFFQGIWEKIKAVWQPVKLWFSDLWGGILHEIDAIWSRIKPVLDAISAFWHRMDSRRGDRRTSAEKDHDARMSGARAAAAAANRAAFNKALGGAFAYVGAIALQLPVISDAAALGKSLQQLHDVGRDDRLARERLMTRPGATALAGPGGQVDLNVNLTGLPRGATTSTDVRGRGLNLKVGKSFSHS
jgi:hypothetical protein